MPAGDGLRHYTASTPRARGEREREEREQFSLPDEQRGGSLDSASPTIADGMIFANSGNGLNVLAAFAPRP